MMINKHEIIGLTLLVLMVSVTPVYSQNIVIRPTIVIDFPNSGPDFQFYRLLDANDSQNRWRYTIHWDSIIEYNDSNQNGIFNPSQDIISKNISFNKIDFSFSKLSANLTGLQDQVVTGSKMRFYGNLSLNKKLCFITITIGWWNDAVLHPYGTKFIQVDTSQSKYSLNIENWTFSSISNRLAVLTSIETTTNKSSYDFTNYNNGTISMITKTDPDGNGKRGGIINNPNMSYIDSQSFEPMNMDFQGNSDRISLQYSFPSFNNSLLYDPTYSAVAEVAGTRATTSKLTNSLNSFEVLGLAGMLLVIGVLKKWKRKFRKS